MRANPLSDEANQWVQFQELKQSSDLADDMVMVDAGPSQDRIEKSNGQDDLGFVIEKPKPLQRASTSAKRPGNKLMGLLNGFQKTRRMSETYERPRGKTIMGDEGNTGRKRTVTSGNDAAKRIRRDDRRMRRSERPDVTVAGLVIDDHKPDDDVPPGLDDSEARREERRLRRASKLTPGKDARDAEDRRTRRRELDLAEQNAYRTVVSEAKDKKTRKEEELEASRQEERRARRAAAKEEKTPRDLGFDLPEKRSSRRERKPIEKEDPNVESSRPHRSERRRSYMDKPLSPTSEPEHRPHRTRRTTAERLSHRKSTAIGDYFDPRNGAAEDPIPTSPLPPPDPQEPYMHGANDPTSSWVKSQISEPPPPPPPEPAVLDPAPRLGGPPDEDAEEEARRARRRERRQSKYRNDDGEDVDRRRRRKEREIRSSEGSGDGALKERRRSDYGGVALKGIDSKGFGAGAGKRGSSWFKKIGL